MFVYWDNVPALACVCPTLFHCGVRYLHICLCVGLKLESVREFERACFVRALPLALGTWCCISFSHLLLVLVENQPSGAPTVNALISNFVDREIVSRQSPAAGGRRSGGVADIAQRDPTKDAIHRLREESQGGASGSGVSSAAVASSAVGRQSPSNEDPVVVFKSSSSRGRDASGAGSSEATAPNPCESSATEGMGVSEGCCVGAAREVQVIDDVCLFILVHRVFGSVPPDFHPPTF